MARSLSGPISASAPVNARTTAIRLTPAINPSLLLFLSALLVIFFVLCLVLGSVNIPLNQIVQVLLGGEADKAAWTNIILKFRLPKAITAVFAGAALSVSGLMMQTFFRNPLADPFTLGINSGASLGVALVVLIVGGVGGTVLAGLGFAADVSMALAASLGAGFTMLLMILTARRVKSTATLLIVGLMFGSLVGAVVSLLLFFSIPQRIQAFLNWGFGTFSSVTWSQLQIMIPAIVVGLLIAFLLGKSLNALLSGEAYARSMGLNVTRTRTLVILATGILSGTVTAFCGPIGFLGIAVPHLCRGVFRTSDHRILTPAVMLVGATAALLAVLIAEVPGSSLVLPVNAITALMGAPVVIHVITRQART